MDLIPGILIIGVIAVLIFMLFKGWRRKNPSGEASRTKYILIWLLAGFVTNIVLNLFSSIWFAQFPKSLLFPEENFTLFLIHYGLAGLLTYLTFIFVYSRFKNLVRSKVVPFVWVFSILGALVNIVQISSARSFLSAQYPNYVSFNSTVAIISQIIVLVLITRWIRKNPGFKVLQDTVRKNDYINIDKKLARDFSNSQSEEPKANKNEPGEQLLSKDDGPNSPISEQSKNKNLSDGNIPGLNEERLTNLEVNPSATSGDNDQTNYDYNSQIDLVKEDNENYTDIVSDRNMSSNKMYLKDEIYAAAKFGDTSELIKLLKIDGLEIELKSGKFVVQSSDGNEKVFSNEIELTNFGKNYARS